MTDDLRRNFTDAFCRGAKPLNSKRSGEPERTDYRDMTRSTLRLRVLPPSTSRRREVLRTYWFRSDKAGGQHERIGAVGEISLSDARKRALDIEKKFQDDPSWQKKARKDEADAKERAAFTVQHLIDAWLEHMRLRDEVKDSTLAHYRALLRVHVSPKFGDKAVEAVGPGEVAAHLDKLGGKSKRTANQIHQRIGALWRYARKTHRLAVTNPAEDWDPLKEPMRERTLSDDEIRTFWRGLDKPDLAPEPLPAIILKLALLLGQRIAELTGMHESELDLDGRQWTVPATRTKSRKTEPRVNVVPLPPQAVTLIRKALALRGKREKPGPVFPSPIDPDEPMRSESLAKAMSRFCGRLKMERATPHDLRRTWRTLATQERCGVPREIAERVMSHVVGGKVERTYDRNLYMAERRKALETVANVIDAIAAGPRPENVVSIGARQ